MKVGHRIHLDLEEGEVEVVVVAEVEVEKVMVRQEELVFYHLVVMIEVWSRMTTH